MRTSIWMVRHGQTEWNKARRYQGAMDSPLTPFGLQQNAALAKRLRQIPFTLAIVSPCHRARVTAATLLEHRKIRTMEDSRWNDASHGRWEGLTYREVMEQFPKEAKARFADVLHGHATGGESLAEVVARVENGWHQLLRDYRGERILIVTHALPIQLVLCAINDLAPERYWRWRIDLGSVTAINIYAGGPVIRMVNEAPPL